MNATNPTRITSAEDRYPARLRERLGDAAPADLRPARRWVVYPGNERFPLRDAEAVPLHDLADELSRLRTKAPGPSPSTPS